LQHPELFDDVAGWQAEWFELEALDLDCVGDPQAASSGRKEGAAAEAKSTAGARLLQLLAPLLGGQPLRDSRLSGVDSLAVLTLCRQLRLAVPGLALRPQDVFRCSTVGELLIVVEELAVKATAPTADEDPVQSRSVGDAGIGRAVWFAPGQFTGTCKWLYGCRGLLDETCFRRAAARLVARHEGLRAEVLDGQAPAVELVRFLKDPLTLHAALWPQVHRALASQSFASHQMGAMQASLTDVARACSSAMSWSLKGSWPRSAAGRLTEDFLQERIKVVHCRSWREVEQASHQLRDEWQPPFVMGFFLLKGNPLQSRPGRLQML